MRRLQTSLDSLEIQDTGFQLCADKLSRCHAFADCYTEPGLQTW